MVLKSNQVFRRYTQNPPYHRTLLTNSQNFIIFFSWFPDVRRTYDVVQYLSGVQLVFDGFQEHRLWNYDITIVTHHYPIAYPYGAYVALPCQQIFVSWVCLAHDWALIMTARGIKISITCLLFPCCLDREVNYSCYGG